MGGRGLTAEGAAAIRFLRSYRELAERQERKRLWLGMKFLIKNKFGRGVVKDAQGLVGYMVGEYAKVLNAAELENFFDLKKGESPALPVDLDELKKSRSEAD